MTLNAKEDKMKESKDVFKYRLMHLDPTLLRTKTSATLIRLLQKCRKSVDEDTQGRIDYVLQKRKEENKRVSPTRRRKA
jgi:hypothetical protein|tara:strand:- start:181 stop:417 length:237 start_codon:yes stop_codon:yes gene_type:complete